MLVFVVLSERQSNQAKPGRPTMCRNCGAIVGAGEAQCAVCSAPAGSQPQPRTQEPRPPDRETIRFARAILNRPYKFTIFLLIANLFVFLLMWESSGLSSEGLLQIFSPPVLEAYGAKLNSLIDAPNYQWWRFITPMFVHVNLLHLLINMYGLMMIGPFVEKLYGSAKFVVFWVLTGIAGVVASYLTVRPELATSIFARFIFKNRDELSMGASGALFGLVGVLFVFGIKFRRELPEGFKRAFGTGMLPIIFINLGIGFLGSGLFDNAAHLGGLLSGAALAVGVDYRRPGVRASITNTWRVLQILSLSIVAVGFYKVARNFIRPAAQVPAVSSSLDPNRLNFLNYVRVMNEVQEKVSAVIHNKDVSDVELVKQRAMEAPVPDARAAELRLRLLDILTRLAGAVTGSPQSVTQAQLDQKLIEELDGWRKEYDEWFKSASKTYRATE